MKSLKFLLKFFFTLIISLIIIWYLYKNFSIKNIIETLNNINWILIFFGVFIRILLYYVTGIRWKFLYPMYSIKASINGVIIGIAANTIIPMRGGDFFRALYIKQITNISKIDSIARIITEKILDIISILILLLISIIFIGNKLNKNAISISFLGIIIVFIIIILIIIYKKNYIIFDNLFFKIIKYLKIPKKIQLKIKSFLYVFKKISIFKLIFSIIISLILSFISITSIWILLLATGLIIPYYHTVIIFPLLTISIALPFTIGYIGIYHASMITGFVLLGYKINNLIGPVIINHFFTVIPPIIYGWILLLISLFKKNNNINQ